MLPVEKSPKEQIEGSQTSRSDLVVIPVHGEKEHQATWKVRHWYTREGLVYRRIMLEIKTRWEDAMKASRMDDVNATTTGNGKMVFTGTSTGMEEALHIRL